MVPEDSRGEEVSDTEGQTPEPWWPAEDLVPTESGQYEKRPEGEE